MPIASTGTIANAYLYSGERFDSGLNLYHLRARYYNQATGRFETMDPALGKIFNPGTLHKFSYAQGDPVNLADPSGRDILEYIANVGRVARSVVEGTKIGESALCYARFVADVTNLVAVGFKTGVPINQNIVWAYRDLTDCLELASLL